MSSVGYYMMFVMSSNVDVDASVKDVLLGGDAFRIVKMLLSMSIGALLFALSKTARNHLIPPLVLSVAVLVNVACRLFYGDFEQARKDGWFWTESLFSPKSSGNPRIAPHDLLSSLLFPGSSSGSSLDWTALYAALPAAIAMAAVFALRESIHFTIAEKTLNNVPEVDASSAEYKVKPETVIKAYSLSNLLSGIFFTIPCVENVSATHLYWSVNCKDRAPFYFHALQMLLLRFTNFKLLLYVPKATFSSLLVLLGLQMFDAFLKQAYCRIPTLKEFMIIPGFVALAQWLGLMPTVGVGAAFSVAIFVNEMNAKGVVKYVANGLTLRSSIERFHADATCLDKHGDLIQCICLQSYLFFGNSHGMVTYVESMFEDVDVTRLSFSKNLIPPIPDALILDFSLVLGMDVSTSDSFKRIYKLCVSNGCSLIMCGVSRQIAKILNSSALTLAASAQKRVKFVDTLDVALGAAEDIVLENVGRVKEMERIAAKERKMIRQHSIVQGADRQEINLEGFRYALHLVDVHLGLNVSEKLSDSFASYVYPVDLEVGENLHAKTASVCGLGDADDVGGGLFFIEYGLIQADRDPQHSIKSNSVIRRQLNSSTNSISALDARSLNLGQSAYKHKLETEQKKSLTFRLARLGPGFVVGCAGYASGLTLAGSYTAVTDARVFYLSKTDIDRVKDENVEAALVLYQTLARNMGRNLDSCIDQLDNYVSIIAGSSGRVPLPDRVSQGRINSAMSKVLG